MIGTVVDSVVEGCVVVPVLVGAMVDSVVVGCVVV